MLTIVSDAEVCTRAELLEEVGAADPMLLLAGLARRSAVLEQSGDDGALENRLAVAVLANAVLQAPSPARQVDGARANYPRLLRRANGVTGTSPE